MSSVQQGNVVQNQSRLNTSNSSEEAPSTGIPLNSFNIINNLANINNGAVGNSPKIVPTIATSARTVATGAFPSSSTPAQLLINNENSNINNHGSDNSIRRNNLVNVQLQQTPILLPPPNSNINQPLPQQPVVAAAAAIPAPSVSVSSNASIQNNPTSMGGLMQVMGSTPCLIPQPNGVPIIVNVPTANYVQVPNQSTSTNCNIPLVNSLLAANILANTNILNGGNNGIINPTTNNDVIRPTLVANNNSGIFLTPSTLSGLHPTIPSVSSSNTTILSYKPTEVNNGVSNVSHIGSQPHQHLGMMNLRVPFQGGQQTSISSQNNLERQLHGQSRRIQTVTNNSNIPMLAGSPVSKPPSLLGAPENIQSINVNERDIKRVLVVKNEQQTLNPSLGQMRPLSLSASCEVMPIASDETPQEMRKIYREKATEKSQMKTRSPSPSTSSDPRYLNASDEVTHSSTKSNKNAKNKNMPKTTNPVFRKSGSKSSKGKERAAHQQETCRKELNEDNKTQQNEQLSDLSNDDKDNNNTAIERNVTSDNNSQASGELSLATDDQFETTSRLESKMENEDNPIKDEGTHRKLLSNTPVFGFTQYAADSPYPAASLNFSSVWSNLVSPRDTPSMDRTAASTSEAASLSSSIQPLSIKQESSESVLPQSSLRVDMDASCTIKTEINTEEDSLTNEPKETFLGNPIKQAADSEVVEDETNNRYLENSFVHCTKIPLLPEP